jgi:hypothetical protein
MLRVFALSALLVLAFTVNSVNVVAWFPLYLYFLAVLGGGGVLSIVGVDV